MAKPFQFDFLLQRAMDNREQAALVIAAAVTRLRQAGEKHVQVTQYRSEYHAKLDADGRRGMPAHQWTEFKLFLEKLNTAVEHQAREISRCEAQLQSAKDAWLVCEKDVRAFETLRERHDEREAKQEVKLEQRMSDEWAANLHRNRQS